jgi:hypothetical protein
VANRRQGILLVGTGAVELADVFASLIRAFPDRRIAVIVDYRTAYPNVARSEFSRPEYAQ